MASPLALPAPHGTDSWRFVFLAWHGRLSRRSFWLHGVCAMLGAALYLSALLGIAGVPRTRVDTAVNLILLYPLVAVSAKRWQDRGRSPWWVLIALVPVVGWLWMLVDNGFVRGDPEPNRYGPPPAD